MHKKTQGGHEKHGKKTDKPHSKSHHDKTPIKGPLLMGSIFVTAKGVGYAEIQGAPESAEDIEIAPEHLNTALNNDEVEIGLFPLAPGKRQTGKVVRIIKRAKNTFVGTIHINKNTVFLIPDDKKVYKDIYITDTGTDKRMKNKMKAQVEITEWTDPERNPKGKIIKIIGKKGDNDAEMHSIVLEKGFDTDFPPEVEAEAEHIERTEKPIPQAEIAKRKDFRHTLTFTIDPVDAKDFDDAISYKPLEDGNAEIGVHIADVSHYVREGTALDREAVKRGFSVYLVDRTIPMLPEVLSNDICSLNPREDKLTFSAVFIIDKNAKVKSSWFGKTIINSDKRWSYEEAQERINQGSGEYAKELIELNRLAKIMQKEKFSAGAIDFEQTEVKFELDETGKPIRVYKKERLDTHKLVEEYMLLANRGVAEFISKAYKAEGKTNAAMIYRIHDLPNAEKIKDLAVFIKALGYELEEKNGEIHSKDLTKLLTSIEGKPEAGLIRTAAIRSMAKAVYSTQNVGHFGLAFKYYTHFTSPIRRYADLMVHRLLARHLNKEPIQSGEIARYQSLATKNTEREISAAEAERASIKYKQVEFMQDKVGQVFDGIISGVTEWGIYIEEKDTRCEGMIRLRDLTDDYYKLDQKNYTLVGEKKHKKYRLGDSVKFRVMKADLEAKTLDFALV
ncbi:MAG: ribonuclease R [Candidatus Pacebacteria bacterium]|nr:ribonuclease R [Candidatus Paceibacterota bacterium]MDD5356635.1 ribonuclease R [Candidatus Paceibacterota bacterium]